MYNIWNGTIKLNGKKLEVGQNLRIDLYNMSIAEVKELESFDYKEVTEGHTTEEYTRMYIEIIGKKEIKMTDCFTKKEFNNKASFYDLTENKAVIWNDEEGLYIEVYTLIDEEYVTIAYSNNFEDTETNKKFLIKNLNKAVTKYKKWFKDNDLNLEVVKEITTV